MGEPLSGIVDYVRDYVMLDHIYNRLRNITFPCADTGKETIRVHTRFLDARTYPGQHDWNRGAEAGLNWQRMFTIHSHYQRVALQYIT